MTEFLSVPEVGHLLGVRQQELRTLIKERKLLAVRRGENNALSISRDQLDEGETTVVLAALPGTLTLLGDLHFTDEEAFTWLHSYHEDLQSTPMQALRAGRQRAVRTALLVSEV